MHDKQRMSDAEKDIDKGKGYQKSESSKWIDREENGRNVNSDKATLGKSEVDFTRGGIEDLRFYPDNPEHHRHKYKWVNKEPSKFYDPCEESRQASINCVLRNQEDRMVCSEFFDAYKECKKDFFQKRRKDRSEGRKGWGIW